MYFILDAGRKLARLLGCGLSFLGLLVVAVTFTPLTSWWARSLAGPMNNPRGDILIVLGGSDLHDALLGENSYWRCVYAVRAYRQGRFQKVVLSGRGGPGTSMTGLMSDFLRSSGVPAESIQEETRSESTRENALYLKDLLAGAAGRKVLLTSDYHMFRARRVFRKAGMDVLPYPVPDAIKRSARWSGRWPAFLDLLEESTKICVYFFKGWI